MKFDDHQLSVQFSGHTVTIIVKGDLIRLLWEANKRLKTAPEIIEANLALIINLAGQKIDEEGAVHVQATDLPAHDGNGTNPTKNCGDGWPPTGPADGAAKRLH